MTNLSKACAFGRRGLGRPMVLCAGLLMAAIGLAGQGLTVRTVTEGHTKCWLPPMLSHR